MISLKELQNLLLSALSLLIGSETSYLNFWSMIVIFTYLAAVFYFAKLLYIIFVERKFVKGGKDNFKIFPLVGLTPVVVVIIVEIIINFWSIVDKCGTLISVVRTYYNF